MNKSVLLLIVISFFIGFSASAQTSYQKYLKKGDESFDENKYLAALEFYDLAYEFARTSSQKNKAREGKTKSKEKLGQQQEELLRALANAKKMQSKMELAVFDRAIKEEIPSWRGYQNYRNKTERQNLLATVKKLNFYNASLVRLPEEVKFCKSLKEINLLANYEFPDEEWNNTFKFLDDLDSAYAQISVNKLDFIDENHWKNISGLEIIGKNLTKFPHGIVKMGKLKYLDISGNEDNQNKFGSLPEEFYKLDYLEELKVNYCNLDSLSFAVAGLKNLKRFDLKGNNLMELPSGIQQLEKLNFFNLSKNKIELSEIFSQLPYIDNDIIISTDVERENTVNDKLLIIAPDNLLSKSVADLPIRIVELDLAESKQIKLDSVLPAVENLKKKIIITTRKNFNRKSENLLITIPKQKKLPNGVITIENLTYLDLSQIDSLNIIALFQLFSSYEKDIYLSTSQNNDFNDINAIWICIPKTNEIPAEIGLLSNLVSLDLSGCKLSNLPKEIGGLKKLTALNLSDNQLSELPKEIKKLQGLSRLNLSNNLFKDFPKELLRVKSIKQLDLSKNYVEEVPNEISKLDVLSELNLANNRLEQIPEEVNKMKSIQSIDVVGNDIRNSNDISQKIQVKTDRYQLSDESANIQILKMSKGKLEKNNIVSHNWTKKNSGKRDKTIAIILGFTASPYLATIKSVTNTKYKSSVHFIISRQGNITQLVNADYTAWHTGRSEFKDFKNLNNFSIGISLENLGPLKEDGENYKSWSGNELTKEEVIKATHQNETKPRYWQVYSQAQIETTYNLCNLLIRKYPEIKYVLGQDEISAGRKLDPGPAFPLEQLREMLGFPLNKK